MAHGSSQPMAQAAGYAPSDLLDDPGALCDPQSGARGPVAEHHRCAQQYNPDTTYGTGIYMLTLIPKPPPQLIGTTWQSHGVFGHRESIFTPAEHFPGLQKRYHGITLALLQNMT